MDGLARLGCGPAVGGELRHGCPACPVDVESDAGPRECQGECASNEGGAEIRLDPVGEAASDFVTVQTNVQGTFGGRENLGRVFVAIRVYALIDQARRGRPQAAMGTQVKADGLGGDVPGVAEQQDAERAVDGGLATAIRRTGSCGRCDECESSIADAGRQGLCPLPWGADAQSRGPWGGRTPSLPTPLRFECYSTAATGRVVSLVFFFLYYFFFFFCSELNAAS